MGNPFVRTQLAFDEATLLAADPLKVIERHLHRGSVEAAKRTVGLPSGTGEGRARRSPPDGEVLPASVRGYTATMKDVEDWYLARVLRHTGDNLAQSARILGVDRTTVRRRARKLGKG